MQNNEIDPFEFSESQPDESLNGIDPFAVPDEPDTLGSSSSNKNTTRTARNDNANTVNNSNANNANNSNNVNSSNASKTSGKKPKRVKGDYSGKWIDSTPHKPSANELKTKHDLRLMVQENLISSLMRQPDRITDAVSMLQDDDFDDVPCRQIFAAMRHLIQNGKDENNINAGTIQVQLEEDGTLISAGGPQKIISLVENGYTAGCIATVDTYARVIKDSSTKLKVIKDLQDNDLINSLQVDSGISAKNIIDKLQSKLADISGSIETNGMSTTVPEYYDTFIEKLHERARIYQESDNNTLAASGGIPTGFKTLDDKLHGWQPGNTIVVGARTGIGKSVCAVNFATAAALAGKSVLFFSMEMTIDEIMTRFVACLSGVSINKMVSGSLDENELKKAENASDTFHKMKITIDTSQDATIEYIRSTAMKKAQSEEGLDLIIIDYLGLIKYVGDRTDRQNQIADMSRALKEIAMTMNIPVIILVQLDNRLRGEEAEEEPTLAHIRESGAIANDSNVIILLHRRKDETKKASDIPTKFIIEKNRGGEKGSFMCHSLLWRSKFEEISQNGDGTFDDDNDNNNQNTIESSATDQDESSPTTNTSSVDESANNSTQMQSEDDDYDDFDDEFEDDDTATDDSSLSNNESNNEDEDDEEDENFDALFG